MVSNSSEHLRSSIFIGVAALANKAMKEKIWVSCNDAGTVAAVPGMVGGMLLHLRSLRKFEHSGGWVKALLEEAENERMHLMTMVELVRPKWYERLLVLTVQGVFFNAFFVLYVLSPKAAHRVVGSAIAIDYWRLPKDATLKDVITVIRADEAHHRDVNHFASYCNAIVKIKSGINDSDI
ncbi:Ubiquinol oxidase 2, mitochondrial [Vitis vinifera]|uniref:Ubiquinol oxidase n=1 Tax=Vitis vinifera TaxID=29760 RepID=A0A438GQS7_VITVI|nr:Ubiquinol oxidase 2, mitochondrial [Vitis vinifera]